MLKELSEKYDIDIGTLEQIKSKTEKQYKDYPIPDADKEKYVALGVINFCKQQEYSKRTLKTFNGIVLTMAGINDGVKKRRLKAVEKYEEDPRDAINKGLVQELKNGIATFINKDGTIITKKYQKVPDMAIQVNNDTYIIPLDNVKTWDSGSENFNYLKALPEHKYFTTLQGFVFKDDKPIAFSMSYDSKNEQAIGFPMYKVIEFGAKVMKEESGVITLKATKDTKFRVISDDIKSYVDVINSFYSPISSGDVEKIYKEQKSSYDVNSMVGLVRNVHTSESTFEKPYPWSTIFLTTIDNDEAFKIVCHPSLLVKHILPGSFVKVWGTISEGKKYDPETKKSTDEIEYSMFGSGIYVLGEINDEDSESESENKDTSNDYDDNDDDWET